MYFQVSGTYSFNMWNLQFCLLQKDEFLTFYWNFLVQILVVHWWNLPTPPTWILFIAILSYNFSKLPIVHLLFFTCFLWRVSTSWMNFIPYLNYNFSHFSDLEKYHFWKRFKCSSSICVFAKHFIINFSCWQTNLNLLQLSVNIQCSHGHSFKTYHRRKKWTF